MQTPPPPTQEQKDYAKFQNDYQDYQNSLSEYSALSNGNGTDIPGTAKLHTAYQTELNGTNGVGGINWKNSNPWMIFISVMKLILDPGTAEINNKIDLTGQESKCQTSLLKCQNDLQNITNDKGGGPQGLIDEATGLNQMIGALSGNDTTSLGQGLGTVGQETQVVFGASGCADLESNALAVRQQIYFGGTGNPASFGANNPASDTSPGVYFHDNDGQAGLMTSYGQMQRNLSKQGDPDNAIEANTKLTNAYGTNTSILQSVQQKTKEQLSEVINVVKTIESAGSMIGHSVSQVSSAALQNMRGN